MIELVNTFEAAAAGLAIGAGLSIYAVVGYAFCRRGPRALPVVQPAPLDHSPGCFEAIARSLRTRPIVPLQRPRLVTPETVH